MPCPIKHLYVVIFLLVGSAFCAGDEPQPDLLRPKGNGKNAVDVKAIIEKLKDKKPVASEAVLLAQLENVPHLPSLTVDEMNVVVQKYNARSATAGDLLFDVAAVAVARPELKSLPLRSFPIATLKSDEAEAFAMLSKVLREHLTKLAPADRNGNRPAPDKLREKLLEEKSNGAKRWQRDRAVPTLNQMLMHEDARYRSLLVELLSKIDSANSTRALVQRAIFDISPDIRVAAIEALQNRRAKDYRPFLLKAMRHPWPPAADHAAQALVALNDAETIPDLARLLDEPDPQTPFRNGEGAMTIRELVRVNHSGCCLMCHPPAKSASDKSPAGAVPGVNLLADGRLVATPTRPAYYETRPTPPNESPLLARANISYLRQDFSATLRSSRTTARFDFIVRTRQLSKEEAANSPQRGADENYPQREAVLLALRGLSKQDRGTKAESWQNFLPDSAPAAEAAKLADELVSSESTDKPSLIQRLRDEKGLIYTVALEEAIPRLNGEWKTAAREALVERMMRMTLPTLREKLENGGVEERRAAVTACSRRGDKTLILDLVKLLGDEEDELVAVLAGKAIVKLEDLPPANN